MEEIIFESHLLEDGHLDCPKEYANPNAQFKVTVYLPDEATPDSRRPFGLGKGDFVVPDDFDAPLPDHIIDEFEGKLFEGK